MNIFFAVIAILGVLLTVNTSLNPSKAPSTLAIQEDNISELEEIFLKKSQRIRMQMAAIEKLKRPIPLPEAILEKKEDVVVEEKIVKKQPL